MARTKLGTSPSSRFAMLVETSGMALQFRFFDPSDVDAVFAQAAAIAATWRIETTP